MRPYQRSFLDQSQSQFIPIAVPKEHELVVLSDHLDWDLLQAIGESRRDAKRLSSRGLKPHHRVLMGAVVVRSLKKCNLREAEDLIKNYLIFVSLDLIIKFFKFFVLLYDIFSNLLMLLLCCI